MTTSALRGGGRLLAMALVLLLAPASGARAGDPPPGTIRFRAHMPALGDSGGEFARWRVDRATIDEQHPERSTVEVTVDLDSIDTGIGERDRHLRSGRFFDTARYPTAGVRLEHPRLEDAGHFMADVTLDLHGQTRTFPMRFTVTDRAARRITGEVTLHRSDYGIGPAPGAFSSLAIDDDVVVTVEAVVPGGVPTP